MPRFVNSFEQAGNWYKANLHTHTTASDGSRPAAERAEQYRRAGYDILAITDHRTTSDVAGWSDEEMLVVGGMEYHPPCPTNDNMFHIVALNVPHGFGFDDPDDANRCIGEVQAGGGESVLAHPYWTGHVLKDFRYLENLAAVEIYNSTCDRHGRAGSENEWAHCLDRGYVLPVVGVDDTHADIDAFQCWTWFKMPSLSAANLLEALRGGTCYVSCGPKIHDFRVAEGKVSLRCSPAAKIYFSGGPCVMGARRLAEKGKSIRGFSIGVPAWPHVRAVVVDAAGREAWTQPIFLSDD